MRYGQIRNRLMRCVGSLHQASASDRQQMMDDLTGDGSLSDSDDSPSNGYGHYETALKVDTYKDVHGCLVRLMELATLEEVVSMMHIFAEAFSVPPPDPPGGSSSGESMPEETTSQRLARYRDASQAEVSDPHEWATIHYGPEVPDDDGVQEL